MQKNGGSTYAERYRYVPPVRKLPRQSGKARARPETKCTGGREIPSGQETAIGREASPGRAIGISSEHGQISEPLHSAAAIRFGERKGGSTYAERYRFVPSVSEIWPTSLARPIRV
mgnify:CR=1 FL=1